MYRLHYERKLVYLRNSLYYAVATENSWLIDINIIPVPNMLQARILLFPSSQLKTAYEYPAFPWVSSPVEDQIHHLYMHKYKW